MSDKSSHVSSFESLSFRNWDPKCLHNKESTSLRLKILFCQDGLHIGSSLSLFFTHIHTQKNFMPIAHVCFVVWLTLKSNWTFPLWFWSYKDFAKANLKIPTRNGFSIPNQRLGHLSRDRILWNYFLFLKSFINVTEYPVRR